MLFSFTITIPIIFILVIKSQNILRKERGKMTNRTYQMHKELLKTLIFQVLVPTCTLSGPFITAVALIAFGVEEIAHIVQTSYIFGTLHSTMNTIMMIYFVKPYRRRFIYYFWQMPKTKVIQTFGREQSIRAINQWVIELINSLGYFEMSKYLFSELRIL